MKRPAFMFYPGDWLHDAALRMCSFAARGLWADMLCVMHQGSPYGHLALQKNGDRRVISPADLAHMLGGNLKEVQVLLDELEGAGVFSRTAEGTIYSRRMVADEKVRETRASCGAQSLDNPRVPRPRIDGKDIPKDPPPYHPSTETKDTPAVPSFDGAEGRDAVPSPSSSISVSVSPSLSNSKEKHSCSTSLSVCESVYQLYPRKVGKRKALAEINKALNRLKDGERGAAMAEPEALNFLAGKVREFAASAAGRAGQYCPHPSSWFAQSRYLDEGTEPIKQDPVKWKDI